MPNETKFTQRNSAAGTGLKSNLMKDMMKSNTPSNAPKPSSSTKPNTTKTSGSNVKPSTTKTTATKPMKTQNIPEVTVSVTKKKVVAPKPVTPPMKEKGSTNKYIQRTAGGEYIELTAEESSKAPKGSKVQTLTESQYKGSKNRILPVGSKVVMMGGQETVLNAAQYANYMSKRKTK